VLHLYVEFTLFDRKIELDFIEKAKSSVELETGEPGWLSRLFGFDLLGSFWLRYFPTPDFYDSEFGIKYPSYTNDEFRLSNRRLTYDQLIKHFDDYYRPSNMMLFVSGKFDSNKMLDLIKDEFGKQSNVPGKTVLEIIPVPNNNPYRRVYNSIWITPHINIGVKYYRLNPKEILSLSTYLDYLAHRLMKELRNKKGETYTVNVYADEKFNAGFGFISFETTHEMFNKNLNYVQSVIQNETQMGEMSDEQIIEAITFAKKQRFELADSDAATLMKYAIYYHDFTINYGADSSPYEVHIKLTTDEFRDAVNNVFNKRNSYTTIFYPYIYSSVEKIIIFLVTIVCSIIVFRKTFRRKIDETKVRWVQNLVYSPGMFLEILVIFLLSLILYSLVNTPIKRLLSLEPWYNSLMLWPTYLFDTFSTFLYIGLFTGLLSYFPKKLIIQGDDLVLKSIALYVRRIKKESIGSIETISYLSLLISPRIWFSLRFRYFSFDWKLWRKGLLIKFKDGRVYFIGVKNAENVKNEVNRVLFGTPST